MHRRVAINLIGLLGTRPDRLVGGFLLASAAVSMWVSNTATALMMLPIALSIVQLLPREGGTETPGHRAFATALLLSVAYGATTGGMATLIGTPPNALLAAYVAKSYGVTLGFGQWMLLGVPVMLVTLPVVYLILTRVSFRLERAEIPGMAAHLRAARAELGTWSRGEIGVLWVFVLTALAWIFQPLLARGLPLLTDTTIAIAGGLALFFIPVQPRRGAVLLDWEFLKGPPWDDEVFQASPDSPGDLGGDHVRHLDRGGLPPCRASGAGGGGWGRCSWMLPCLCRLRSMRSRICFLYNFDSADELTR